MTIVCTEAAEICVCVYSVRAAAKPDNLLEAGTDFRTEPDGKDEHAHLNSAVDFHYLIHLSMMEMNTTVA